MRSGHATPDDPLLADAHQALAQSKGRRAAGPAPRARRRNQRRCLGTGWWDRASRPGCAGPSPGSRLRVRRHPASGAATGRARGAAGAGEGRGRGRRRTRAANCGRAGPDRPVGLLEVVAPDQASRRHAKRRVETAGRADARSPPVVKKVIARCRPRLPSSLLCGCRGWAAQVPRVLELATDPLPGCRSARRTRGIPSDRPAQVDRPGHSARPRRLPRRGPGRPDTGDGEVRTRPRGSPHPRPAPLCQDQVGHQGACAVRHRRSVRTCSREIQPGVYRVHVGDQRNAADTRHRVIAR